MIFYVVDDIDSETKKDIQRMVDYAEAQIARGRKLFGKTLSLSNDHIGRIYRQLEEQIEARIRNNSLIKVWRKKDEKEE